jgi:hypothetical protein
MSAFKTNSSQPVKVEPKSEVVFEVSKSQQVIDTARKVAQEVNNIGVLGEADYAQMVCQNTDEYVALYEFRLSKFNYKLERVKGLQKLFGKALK